MNSELASAKIIAAVLEAEFGAASAAQIGLAETDNLELADLPAAQQRFTDRLLEVVIGATRSEGVVLLAGADLGGLGKALAASNMATVWLAGRQWEGLSPTDAGSSLLQIEPSTLLDGVPTESYDCIVLAGTFQYLDQLPILTRCRELLCAGGALFIAGEFLLDDANIAYSSLANLSSHEQLAERLGFRRVQVLDLHRSAQRSVQLFNSLMQQHAGTVSSKLGLDAATYSAWSEVFSTMQSELESGRRTYQLRQWRLPDPAHDPSYPLQLGEYARAVYGDIDSFASAEISRLFEQSFHKDFDADLWHWKYHLGKGKCIVARIERNGEIVAHYGGAPRAILYFGQPGMAIQVCDVMVLPEKRRQYGKSSLFFKAAATFLEREIGYSVNHLLGFGFPNQSAMNIATRLGLYEKTDDFVEIVFANPASNAPARVIQALDGGNARHRAQVDRLWQQMAADFTQGIIGKRDWQYIKYRYLDHPGAKIGQFRCLLLQAAQGDEIEAIVVLKQHGNLLLIMDIICPLHRLAGVIAAINQQVKRESPELSLGLWLTRGWLHALPLDGAIVNELGIEIPCNSWNPGPVASTLYGKWWLTAGDMDFM